MRLARKPCLTACLLQIVEHVLQKYLTDGNHVEDISRTQSRVGHLSTVNSYIQQTECVTTGSCRPTGVDMLDYIKQMVSCHDALKLRPNSSLGKKRILFMVNSSFFSLSTLSVDA